VTVTEARSFLPQIPKALARRVNRLSGLVTLMVALAFGAHLAAAQNLVKDVQPGPTTGHLRPLELVRSSVARAVMIVQSQSAGAAESGKRRVEMRQVAVDLFNFDDMSRRMLAQHWKNAPRQEQEEFVRLFTDLLERSYMTTIGTYAHATITFQGESVDGSYAQVRSRMTPEKGAEVPIEYRLFETDGRWAVYDVVVDGVSLISSYRSQFNTILRRSTFAQLLERMRNREAQMWSRTRVSDLRGGRALLLVAELSTGMANTRKW
jgi:phospholipid transport system substrate-binding protein